MHVPLTATTIQEYKKRLEETTLRVPDTMKTLAFHHAPTTPLFSMPLYTHLSISMDYCFQPILTMLNH
jgi:hypothetical protein